MLELFDRAAKWLLALGAAMLVFAIANAAGVSSLWVIILAWGTYVLLLVIQD